MSQTKQHRMLSDLLKSLNDVMEYHNLSGGMTFLKNNGNTVLEINLYDSKKKNVYKDSQTKEQYSYTQWINEIVSMNDRLFKFFDYDR